MAGLAGQYATYDMLSELEMNERRINIESKVFLGFSTELNSQI
jgi:hypothetical protein